MILDNNGDVWVFGDNSFGQLGILEEVSNRNKIFGTPTKIDASYFNNEKVVQIAASEYTSYALTENGDVYAWGTDYQGQLVIGDDHDIELLGTSEKMINYPVKTLFSAVVSIKARSENVGVLTTDQKVFVAGSNTLKQLGVSSYTNLFSNTPIEVTEKYTKDGTAIVSDIVDFEIGGVANFILLENGDLLSFGSGGSYELGYPVAQVTSVYRQLSTIIAPTKVIFYEPIDLEEIESISDSIYRNQIPLNKTVVIDVEIDDIVRTSGDRTMVRDTEGRFWSFGNNSSGMVASGNVTTVDPPVLSTLYRVEFYDDSFISKNYLIEPFIGVIVTLSLFVGIFIYLEIKLQKQRKREKQFVEMLNSNQIKRT
jgi:alpha-tubulin suppressor-like RCC1 family protein